MNKIVPIHIVSEASKGNSEAFAQLCEAEMPSILYYAYNMFHNKEDAEDIAQEVLLKMHNNISKLAEPRSFRAWVRKITFNECNMMWRTRTKKNNIPIDEIVHVLQDDAEKAPPEVLEDKEMMAMLFDCLESLDAKQHALLTMFYLDGMSQKEIAEILDMNEPAVAQALRRARQKLRSNIEAKDYDRKDTAPALLIGQHMEYTISQAFVDAVLTANEAIITAAIPVAGAVVGAGALLAKQIAKIVGAALGVAVIGFSAYTIWNNNGDGDVPPPVETTISTTTDGDQGPVIIPSEEVVDNSPSVPGDEEEGLPQSPNPPSPGTSTGPDQEADLPLVATPVQGWVQLKNHNGQVLNEYAEYTAGLNIIIEDLYGNILATTTTDSFGRFELNEFAISKQTDVYLKFSAPGGGRFIPTMDNPEGTISLALTPGESATDIVLYMHETGIPDNTIEFVGGDCGCGHVNPSGVVLGGSDVAGARTEWSIEKRSGGVVYSGTGADQLSRRLRDMYDDEEDGSYFVYVYFTDSAGNANVKLEGIVIRNGDIDPNEYY